MTREAEWGTKSKEKNVYLTSRSVVTKVTAAESTCFHNLEEENKYQVTDVSNCTKIYTQAKPGET